MLIGIVVIAAGFFGLVWFGGTKPSENNGEIGTYVSYTKGPQTAKVKITEYADLECPACAAMHPIIDDLLAKYPNDIELTFKHFPLATIHPNALPAAKAAEAAGIQGKFFEMLDLMFTNQGEWSKNSNEDEVFTRYATELGLDVEKFKADIKDATIAAKIKSNYAEGVSLSVRGTPTFFINGTKLENNALLISSVEALLK